jgi:hypothetical protein
MGTSLLKAVMNLEGIYTWQKTPWLLISFCNLRTSSTRMPVQQVSGSMSVHHFNISILSTTRLPCLEAMSIAFMLEFGIAVMSTVHHTCPCGRRHSTLVSRYFHFMRMTCLAPCSACVAAEEYINASDVTPRPTVAYS